MRAILYLRLLARKYCWKRGYLAILIGLSIAAFGLIVGNDLHSTETNAIILGIVVLMSFRFIWADLEIGARQEPILEEIIREPEYWVEGYAHHALGRIAERLKHPKEALRRYEIAWQGYRVQEAQRDLSRF